MSREWHVDSCLITSVEGWSGSIFFFNHFALRIKAIAALELQGKFTALKLQIQIVPKWPWHLHIWIFTSHPGFMRSNQARIIFPQKNAKYVLFSPLFIVTCTNTHTVFLAWQLSRSSVHYFAHLSSASGAWSSWTGLKINKSHTSASIAHFLSVGDGH